MIVQNILILILIAINVSLLYLLFYIRNQLKSKVDTDELESILDKIINETIVITLKEEINSAIQSSLTTDNLKNSISEILNFLSNEGDWIKQFEKNPDDYYLIELLSEKQPSNREIGEKIYKKLLLDYNNEENIGVKRSILQLIDRHVDNMMKNASPEVFEEIKAHKLELERLYVDLANFIQEKERQSANSKINDLKALISQIEDLSTLKESSVLVQEIQTIDSSIDHKLLKTDEILFNQYKQIFQELSSKVEKKQNHIILAENRRAMRNANRLKKEFYENKRFISKAYDKTLINDLSRNLNLDDYDGLLPTTYQYCEKVRINLVEGLNEEQQLYYAKNNFEIRFKD